jgi:uncharacterized protein YdbL (DUF1318 family)
MLTAFTSDTTCIFNLTSLMRRHKVTIRDLSKRMDVTMKDIRRIRAKKRVSYCTYCDYHQGVTGENVFNYNRYQAIQAQFQRS